MAFHDDVLNIKPPKGLIDCIKECVPGFERERVRDQAGIAVMLWAGVLSSRRHKRHRGAVHFHRNELRALFSSDQRFRDLNRDPLWRYFLVHRFQNAQMLDESHTNGYEPRPWMQEALGLFLQSETDVVLVDQRGYAVPMTRHGVKSVDRKGQPVKFWSGDDAPSCVPVDLASLALLENYHLTLLSARILGVVPCGVEYIGDEETVEVLRQTMAIRRLASNPAMQGVVLHEYVQATSGRLYAQGLNLQGCRRSVRDAALNKCWDTDAVCCHFSIASEMAASLGQRYPVLEHYVQNKHQVREAIAREANITVGDAKSVLNKTAYGAPASVRPRDAIPSDIGVEAARRLYKSSTFTALSRAARAAGKFILDNHPKNRGAIVNAAGKRVPPEKKKASEQLSHILTGVEAKALRAAVRLLAGDVILLQHDGFITHSPVDLDELHRVVREATGYDLRFESEQILSNIPDLSRQPWVHDLKVQSTKYPLFINELRRILGGGAVTIGAGADEAQLVGGWPIPPVYPDPIPEGLFTAAPF